MKKTILPFLIVSVVFLIVALFAIYINRFKPSSSDRVEPNVQPSSQEPASILVSAKVVNNLTTKNSYITISLKPYGQKEVLLSAFALKASVSTEDNSQINIANNLKVSPEASLKENSWSFPISNVSQNTDGSLEIEVSGYRLGGNLFTLDKEIVLATIPTTNSFLEGERLMITINPTLTKFLGSSATEEVPITSE